MQTVLILFNCQQENHTDTVACILSQLFPFVVVGLRFSLMSIRNKQLICVKHVRFILIRRIFSVVKEQVNMQMTLMVTHFKIHERTVLS